ncbi:MAG TPA: glycosyltransferase [Steroidobacteraceae bacterium]|nr:glycosyltransferase [Steroidobacteraceae bacterium]
MHRQQDQQDARISAVVPAKDERSTIAGVIEALRSHPRIAEVIVVDDGSTDGTADCARAAGARVVSLPSNGGKAAAMERGVAVARHDVIFFSDADLTGLTPEKIDLIVAPVLTGEYDMFVGIRGRKTYWTNRLLHFTPILGGERALKREIWEQVPAAHKKNFQIEIALNYFAKLNGHRMGFMVVHGIGQVIKERKRGMLPGLWARLLMIRDIVVVSAKLYLLCEARLALAQLAGFDDVAPRR